jgi:non-canonical purine NTP pyrophosphatase (RdgB/HAM1 family)
MKLVLASSNQGKLEELRGLLADTGIELLAQSDLGVEDADETGATFVENALIKARHATAITGLPALADDSGICVDALKGAPGLYSARYAGEHGNASRNIDKLLEALQDVPDHQRTAHFYCVLVLLQHADDPQPLIVEGRAWLRPGVLRPVARPVGGGNGVGVQEPSKPSRSGPDPPQTAPAPLGSALSAGFMSGQTRRAMPALQ